MDGANRYVLLLNPHMKQMIETQLGGVNYFGSTVTVRECECKNVFKFGWYRVRPFRPSVIGDGMVFLYF